MSKIKKAQGMPINVIIIAALALVVLFVLATLFTGRTKLFAENLESCASKQGVCKNTPCDTGEAAVPNTKCSQEEINAGKKTCCVKVFST
ncbi:hypothetical protein HYV80_01665 [Candidatus Woesearchaeota archaeon]|nr:hypothetical protein [Candidatus Woesearchaeota archaeon]